MLIVTDVDREIHRLRDLTRPDWTHVKAFEDSA